jgi:sugar O-acyltransferase (sialic acid O-acetyltransferase NeuD family)
VNKPLYGIYGASGCGRGIMPLARAMLSDRAPDAAYLVFIDDRPQQVEVNGHPVMTFDAFVTLTAPERFVALAIADGKTRERLAGRLAEHGIPAWSVRADSVVVMDDVEIGEGALLSPFTVLTSNIRVGHHFHANLYSYVEHDCVIGDFVTFAPGVKCNGNVVVHDYAYIGSGAILRQGVPGRPLIIGEGATVGMGAVVTRDVAPHTTVVGNPARPL